VILGSALGGAGVWRRLWEMSSQSPVIRSSGRRVKESVELTVTVPIQTIRGLLDDPKA
jgi:hypothetical protein